MTEAIVSVTLDPRFTRLLVRQDDLQTFLLAQRVSELNPADLSKFIREQAFAMVAETIEVADETYWKPWATLPEDGQIIRSKTRYTGELADVFIFFMNLMLAGGVTMTELAQAVDAKQSKNLSRWLNGYDGKNKCPACRRSYDDEDVNCYPPGPNLEPGAENILAYCADRERFIDKEGITV